jgi:ParB family chromosome partitioning protein
MSAQQQPNNDVQFQWTPTTKIDPSPTNPRKFFDKQKLDELTESVKSQGVLEPLLVRAAKKGRFEIIAGERRWRAATAAGLKDVPTVLREMSDDQVLDAQIHENLHRADVHPMDEAFGYQHLLKVVEGLTVEELARRVNKSPRYVAQRLSLTTLIEPAVQDFMEGLITLGHAVQLSRLAPQVQPKALEACYGREFVKYDSVKGEQVYRTIKTEMSSVADLGAFISQKLTLDLTKAPWSLEDATLVEAQGPCSSCPSNTATNQLLFGDAAESAICTNPEGYERKMRAWIDRQVSELKAGGAPQVLLLTAFYDAKDKQTIRRWNLPEGALGTEDFHVVEKVKGRCESTLPAVYVQGNQRGQKAWVCTDRKCKDHMGRKESSSSSRSSSSSTGGEKSEAEKEKGRKRKQELFDARVAEPVRRRVLKALLDKINPDTFVDHPADVTWPLGRDYFVRMAVEHFRRITSDTQAVMYEVLGWEEAVKVKGDSWTAGNRKQDKAVELIMSLGDVALARFLFLCSVAHYGENLGTITGARDQSEIIRVAEAHGIPYQLFDARERTLQSPGKKYHGAHGLHLFRVLYGVVPRRMPPAFPAIYLDEKLWNLSTLGGPDGLEAKVKQLVTPTPWLDGPEGVVLPGARVRFIASDHSGRIGFLEGAMSATSEEFKTTGASVMCKVRLESAGAKVEVVEVSAAALVYVEGVRAELEKRQMPEPEADPSGPSKGAKKAASKKGAAGKQASKKSAAKSSAKKSSKSTRAR